jgi:ribosomal protein S18 acetylase RimI-like enzyme
MSPEEAGSRELTGIRPAATADVDSIVAIHLETFPGFFLTFLGPAFLRLLYAEILASEEGILLVVEDGGQAVGFVAGVTRQSGFYGRVVRKRKWRFAFASMGALLRRPSIAGRLLRALRKREESAASAAEACLMSIGVSPRAGGRGAGKALVRAFAEELRKRSVDRFCLTTDRVDNEAVNAFYARLGFEIARSFTTPEGREMNEYVMTIDRGNA